MSANSKGRPDKRFALSITKAMADQLIAALAELSRKELTEQAVSQLEKSPGIYELFYKEERVYVGKASKSLPDRLLMHHQKISGRKNISLQDISFQCLYVDEDLEAAAPEKMLIKRYGKSNAPWNTNGFGNNDPGKNRDLTKVKLNHFDALYPINLNLPVLDFPADHRYTVKTFLEALKKHLPFNIRFESKTVAARELGENAVELSNAKLTALSAIELVIEQMPDGWQATALPGYVIIYKSLESYPSASVIIRKESGRVISVAGRNQFAQPGEIEDESH